MILCLFTQSGFVPSAYIQALSETLLLRPHTLDSICRLELILSNNIPLSLMVTVAGSTLMLT